MKLTKANKSELIPSDKSNKLCTKLSISFFVLFLILSYLWTKSWNIESIKKNTLSQLFWVLSDEMNTMFSNNNILIHLDQLGKWTEYFDFTLHDQSQYNKIADKIFTMCQKLAPNLFENLQVNNIYIVKEIQSSKSWKQLGWLFFKWDLYIKANEMFFHEIFHIFDMGDGLKDDNAVWARLNDENVEYGEFDYETGEVDDDSNKEIPWFSRKYGLTNWPDDDQATVADQLLWSPQRLNRLLLRCVNDIVLRNKVQVITWCQFNPETKRFSGMMNLDKYTKLSWFDDYEYFPKRSRDNNNRILMNHHYWNALADGKKVYFMKWNDEVAKLFIVDNVKTVVDEK